MCPHDTLQTNYHVMCYPMTRADQDKSLICLVELAKPESARAGGFQVRTKFQLPLIQKIL